MIIDAWRKRLGNYEFIVDKDKCNIKPTLEGFHNIIDVPIILKILDIFYNFYIVDTPVMRVKLLLMK